MKSTIPNVSSFWVKLLPVILMFLCIGLNQAQAQSYKPLDEAVASVYDAIQDLQAELDTKPYKTPVVPTAGNGSHTNAGSSTAPDAKLKIFEVTYFDTFLQFAKSTQDVAAAVESLDNAVNPQGQPQSRVTLITAARAELMELITE